MKLIIVLWSIIFFPNDIFSVSISDIINKKGLYRYSFNIIAKPTDPNDAIIKINASHVIFDFAGYCLTQDSSNVVPGLIGIEIASGVEDVVIRNGSILNLTGNGIKINDGTFGVRLENMIIDGCHQGGILFDGLSTGTGIEKVIVDTCCVASSTGAAGGEAFGLRMNQTKNFEIKKCIFLDNDASTINLGFGCSIENSSNGNITNCSMQNNGGNEQGIGCFLVSCTNIILRNNSSMQNRCRSSAANSFSAGFATRFCDNIVFHSCDSLQNRSDQRDTFGFNVEFGFGNIFENCCSEGNQGDRDTAGIRFIAQSNSAIQQCTCNTNFSINGTAYGIFLDGSANDRCYVAENEIVGNSGLTSRGIVDLRSASTSFFQKNNAFNNGTNYVVSYPSTITLPLIVGSLSSATPGLPALRAGELDNVDVNP